MVVDAVVWNWVEETVESANRQGGREQEGRYQNDLFYMDDGMMAFSDLVLLQEAFSTLVGLFDWVALRKNVGKMVGMVCHPCQAAVTHLEAAYKQRMLGVGPS